MAELILSGCPPTPMAGYLKALGALRLLSDQKPGWSVRGAWREDQFVLLSPAFSDDKTSNLDQIFEVLLHEYRPSPIISPWNGGSGFFYREEKLKEIDSKTGKQKKTGIRNQSTTATKTIDAFLEGTCDRLADYREVIGLAKSILSDLGLNEAPKETEKHALIQLLRATLPENALIAVDAGIALTTEHLGFSPLLGSGWIDGNLDFANNFMQKIKDLIDLSTGQPTPASAAWLKASLSNKAAASLTKGTLGQFFPGRAGGPNSSIGFDGNSLINPWDFVLAFEGSLFFATSTTRRLESGDKSSLAYPFTVRSNAAGTGVLGTGDESKTRDEIWLPLWTRPASVVELKTLFSEGRATVGRRSAHDGLSFARAISGLGVDRGISSFYRYGFLKRFGKNHLATPLSRVEVQSNPKVDLINDLESGYFLDRLRGFARSKHAPAGIRSQVRRLEDALFTLTRHSDKYTLQKILRITGRICFILSRSAKGREAVPLLPRLQERWVDKADDESPEFRCAAALAALKCAGTIDHTSLPLLSFILPVNRAKPNGNWQWAPESRLAVWREGSLPRNLGAIVARRQVKGFEVTGNTPRVGAGTVDLHGFFDAGLDEKRLSELLLGLILVENFPAKLSMTAKDRVSLPASYLVLKPLFTAHAQLVRSRLLDPNQTLPLSGELVANLRANHTQRAVDLGWRRLRASGLPIPNSPRHAPDASNLDGPRLLAALAVPLNSEDLFFCLKAFRTQSSRTPE
ncbi:type I-G CRISPR-associated protein Cas8g1/Csx17 [Candidatus Thiosymbion oneisti]|uniref:type I-G CRISPR-associated protein Cas8g1/Csx17 n=1 Tax=Candidatus Thiosymbion oneisti TaxID=589554 RepID=UPI000AD0303C|nr:type I-U CRISPR-associated protein Csx17 [Candidatus Thiosymbion oneisti]